MPSTVPLETFELTLHVPRTISDAEVATILRLLRRKSFRQQLQKVLVEFLGEIRIMAPVSVTIQR
jgi:hypothetical protein